MECGSLLPLYFSRKLASGCRILRRCVVRALVFQTLVARDQVCFDWVQPVASKLPTENSGSKAAALHR